MNALGIDSISSKQAVEDKEVEKNEKNDQVKKKKDNNKVIVIDGPLGTLITHALNKVYSKTSNNLSMESLMMVNTDKKYDEIEKEEQVDLYVLALDSSSLDDNSVVMNADKVNNVIVNGGRVLMYDRGLRDKSDYPFNLLKNNSRVMFDKDLDNVVSYITNY